MNRLLVHNCLRLVTFLVIAGLLVLLIAIVGVLMRQQYLEDKAVLVLNSTANFETEIQNWTDRLKQDVSYLAKMPAIYGIMRATENGGIDPSNNSSLEEWKTELKRMFVLFAEYHAGYFQLRFIGTADEGREIVRVDVDENGVRVVKDGDLQKKGNRDYVIAIQELEPGEIYISPINLNREHGRVEEPYKPTIRVGVPIYTSDNKVFGVLVLNALVGEKFNAFAVELDELLGSEGLDVYIANKDGDFLLHPKPEFTYGFEFGRIHRWQDELESKLANSILANNKGFLSTSRHHLASLLEIKTDPTVMQPITIYMDSEDPKRTVTVIASIPEQGYTGILRAVSYTIIFFSIFVGCTFLIHFFVKESRKLAAMKVLAEKAKAIAEGDYHVELPDSKSKETTILVDSLKYLQREVSNREVSLKESEERANQIIEVLPEGLIFVNKQGIIQKVNGKMPGLFGYSAPEMIGMPLGKLVPENHKVQHEKHLQVYFEKPEIRSMGVGADLTGVRRDGTQFPVEVGLAPMEFKGEAFAIAVIADVTARRTMERELIQSRDHLEETVIKRTIELEKARDEAARHAQAKGDFLANMSHEIRTPMTAILGLLDILRHTDLDRKQQRYVFQIHNSSRALLNIINDILDISKIEAGKITIEYHPFSLIEVVEGVVDLFSPAADLKSNSIHLRVCPKLKYQLIGDGLRLIQVLNNLVGNAVKFTENGEIKLSIECLETDSSHSLIRFSVKDNGIGIAPDTVSRLFHAFEQADTNTTRTYGGTGLGLPISKNLVELMGGRLHVDSELGKGSTFWFELPFDHSDNVDLTALVVPPQGKKVLVVDDQPVNCEILEEMLHHWDCLVSTTTSGAQATEKYLESLKQGQPFDLIITDWRMPEMDGFSLIESLHKLSKEKGHESDTPVLMVTEAQRQEVEAASNFRQDVELLTKPITISRLLSALNCIGVVEMLLPERCQSGRAQLEQELVEKLETLAVPARVLVVEDNMTNQMVIDEILSGFRLALEFASNGSEALERVQKEHFDLVLMDLQMPVMDGFEATRAIRKFKSKEELPILALSAATFADDINSAGLAGMNDHLKKPIDLEQFFSSLRKWLPRGESDKASAGVPQFAVKAGDDSSDSAASALENLLKELESDPLFDLGRTVAAKIGPSGYARLVKAFTTEFGDILEQWEEGAEWKVKEKERIVHSLKGAAGNIGAVALQEKAVRVEVDIKNGEHASYPELMEVLKNTLVRLSVC